MSDQLKHTLSNELVQAIGDYLISRPYREVAALISGLQQEVQAGAATRTNGITRSEPVAAVETPGDLQ